MTSQDFQPHYFDDHMHIYVVLICNVNRPKLISQIELAQVGLSHEVHPTQACMTAWENMRQEAPQQAD